MCALLLSGCGGVNIAPSPQLPKALVNKTPARVGIVMTEGTRKYVHSETRGGVPWAIALGDGHRRLSKDLVSAAFVEAEEFPTLDAAKAASGLKAIFEPRIDLFTPAGELVDTFTLTGYGNNLAGAMSSADPLNAAEIAAMRDAAAKFLTQFPQQAVAQQLGRGETLLPQAGRPAAAMTAMQTSAGASTPACA